MGLLEVIAEEARRARTADDWYHREEPYVLELRSSTDTSRTGLLNGRAFMTLPLGPQEYSVTRVHRQGITPVMGGLVAEEGGLLWLNIDLMLNFGFAPKFAFDTTFSGPDPIRVNPAGDKLSGPAWARRMLRNYFDKYMKLKADPDLSNATKLIWHDLKQDDHWVVVPEEASLNRAVASRLMFPLRIRMKAIAEADSITIPPAPQIASVLRGIGSARAAIANVRKGIALVNSAIQEGSEILGEVRYVVAEIDSIITGMQEITASAQSFVDGATDTISIGRTFINSTAATLQGALDTMEESAELPAEVRQNYQMALDGLHAVAAQRTAFGASQAEATGALASVERGVAAESRETLLAAESAGPPTSVNALSRARVRSVDRQLVDAGAVSAPRPYREWGGFADYVIKATDTLPSIAAEFLNDGNAWVEIAVLNNLKPPYVSVTGAPGTVRPGDTIAVPVVASLTTDAVAVAETPGTDRLGTDFVMIATPNAIPGRPMFGMAIDKRTFKDFALVSGVDNFIQALAVRCSTERRALPLSPGYGFAPSIGLKSTRATHVLTRLALRETILQDPRVQSVSRVEFEVSADVAEASAAVLPIGSENAATLTTSLI